MLQPPMQLEFPEPKLMASLIQLYFAEYNDFQWPVLHRPTFMQSVQSGQHLREDTFGMIVLLACALGSRFSDDRRVLLSNTDDWHTAGWKWFRQVKHKRQLILMSAPSIYDLQIDCVSNIVRSMLSSSLHLDISSWLQCTSTVARGRISPGQ